MARQGTRMQTVPACQKRVHACRVTPLTSPPAAAACAGPRPRPPPSHVRARSRRRAARAPRRARRPPSAGPTGRALSGRQQGVRGAGDRALGGGQPRARPPGLHSQLLPPRPQQQRRGRASGGARARLQAAPRPASLPRGTLASISSTPPALTAALLRSSSTSACRSSSSRCGGAASFTTASPHSSWPASLMRTPCTWMRTASSVSDHS
jgi:hypothetical protein